MYECGSYRGVLIAALIPLLASVPLRFLGSRGFDATKVNVPPIVPVDQMAREREAQRQESEREERERHTHVLLDAWQFDHPGSWCPNTVDELDRYTVGSHALDHRKLWCWRRGVRGEPPILMVKEGHSTWAPFDPGEVRPRLHRQDELDLMFGNWQERGARGPRGWYKFEAYPAWARAHPGKECPATLDELNVYIGVSDSLDHWGHPMAMQCGPASPTHPEGFFVISAGPDGIFDTEDDKKL